MKMSLRLRNYPIAKLRNPRSRGYILITLMLFMSLLAIAALAVLPDIAFQVKRDREEEMIHRGVAYSRGIRRYYKKFGRYPNRIEDLENTNNFRFIRKRYKDPVNHDRDFKILRMGDPRLLGLMPGQIPGKVTTSSTGVSSGSSSTGQSNVNSSGSSSSSSSNDTSSSTQQVFGGGPMLGVTSTSQDTTIREFCDKNHYKDWLFIYDPTSDRGGLLNSPWCPNLNSRGLVTNPPPPAPGGAPPPPPPPANTPAPQ
jgi:type II secretory pathway pseudopilin PulG